MRREHDAPSQGAGAAMTVAVGLWIAHSWPMADDPIWIWAPVLPALCVAFGGLAVRLPSTALGRAICWGLPLVSLAGWLLYATAVQPG